jgi:hypothetical protein
MHKSRCEVLCKYLQVDVAVAWSAHTSLCKELQRRCDLPECDKRAQDVKCGQCDVATYYSEEHRSAHENRCEELYAFIIGRGSCRD